MADGVGPLDAAGPAAPPRANGELVFAAPWESRAFGLAVALHEQGAFAWDEFRVRLMREIAVAERDSAGRPWSYYACWLRALESLAVEKGWCAAGEIDARMRLHQDRPPGHDH